jgi:DNA-directed RNA polymerase subunit beta'
MTNKVKILNAGDSQLFIGQIIDINRLREINIDLLNKNKTPVTAKNLVLSLEVAPNKTDSFFSSASFQDTKKILTDACVKSVIDPLTALKENVMLGFLIPAGTGLIEPEKVIANGEKMYKKEY